MSTSIYLNLIIFCQKGKYNTMNLTSLERLSPSRGYATVQINDIQIEISYYIFYGSYKIFYADPYLLTSDVIDFKRLELKIIQLLKESEG